MSVGGLWIALNGVAQETLGLIDAAKLKGAVGFVDGLLGHGRFPLRWRFD